LAIAQYEQNFKIKNAKEMSNTYKAPHCQEKK